MKPRIFKRWGLWVCNVYGSDWSPFTAGFGSTPGQAYQDWEYKNAR